MFIDQGLGIYTCNAYINLGYLWKLKCSSPFLFIDGPMRERAETKERRSAMARRKRFERWIEGVELPLVEATENENGDGVNAGGAAGE